ncbi:MAG: DNA topoisomerase (ATP-hydrolyzing) subunit B [Ignavibacteriae bacterium HGW-Ignavibacteriae-1]|nr:MAG: DNA topoisomerase (ATP-hydrolyzing) subunit B [Ignavibacteriae bacterium HGW-Ignavibacteriae-1]
MKENEILPEMASRNDYSEDSIKVLEGLEAVRKRPAMYIGDTGERGLHHLIQEVVDNSIDEALAGFCKNITVKIHKNGACSVQDDGRGIPTGPHPIKKISTLQVVMCTLHAGGKFDKNTYKVSGGLHGVGVSCVNALSEYAEVVVKRDGKEFRQTYSEGIPTSEVIEVGKTSDRGTYVYFLPDKTLFKTVEFKYDKTSERLRELAFLNPEVTITFIDERPEDGNLEDVFHYEGGIVDFVKYIDSHNSQLVDIIYIKGVEPGETGAETVAEIAFQYNNAYNENVISYVNNINTIEGGTHVTGFRSALTRTLNQYAANINKKNNKVQLVGDDFREGLTAIISIKVAEPQFEGQTKTKLGNGEVEGIVRTIVNDKLNQYLDLNPAAAKRIIEKAQLAAEARIAAKKSRELVRRKNALENSTLPGKLADCSLNSPVDTEIYIVEGDSAGGSAKQGRDRRFQAILPLKGKILNVQKARINKILENEEIRTIITALGSGFGEDFDPEKLRYGKIILMADADVDGSHIRTLLLTLFFNYMKDLILDGKLYIAQPPLYKLKKGRLEYYAYNDAQRDELLDRIRKESSKNKVEEPVVEPTGEDQVEEDSENELILEAKKDGIQISRFKGLGEMNPDQLWDTTMNPETRTLLQVTLGEAIQASMVFQTLMGDKVEPRREFIERNAHYVKNLDV